MVCISEIKDYAKENNAYVYFDKLMIKEEDLYDMRSSSV